MSSSRRNSPSERSQPRSECPRCGNRRVGEVTEDVVLRVRGKRYLFPRLTHERCGACGERLFGIEASRLFDAAILKRRAKRAA